MTVAALPKARKYNPGFLSDEELIASFCVRTAEFDSMVETLRECTGSSNPHQIVIGPLGSGKTSLLLRVAAEVRRDAALSSAFFPIVFAEESYHVATAGEFWLECLSRLADQAPCHDEAPDLQRTFEDLRTIHDDRTLGERCLVSLLDFSDREGKRLALIVENLNMMFGGMTDPEAGWRLRKTLQTEPRIILLASATSHFEEMDHPGHALYDLFRTLTLRPLDTNECAVLWEKVSGQPRPHDTIRSLEILTGGSPRLLAIVARFGGELSFRNLMDDLLDLVDDHTGYFKSHIDSLPAQERRVYLALAELWKPAATKEIADRSRLETSKCSAHLTRLIERGVVQVAGGSVRRKQYYLTERLYNIYYLLRRNREPDRLIEALIRFMASYYSPPELLEISARMVRESQGFNTEMRSLYRSAFTQLMGLPALAEYREELLATTPADFVEALHQVSILPDKTKTASVIVDRDRQLHDSTDEHSGVLAAKALFDKATLLWKENRVEDALVTLDKVLHRYGESDTPAFLGLVARALVNKGIALSELNRSEEGLAIYDEVLRRYGERDTPTLLELVAKALVNKGIILGRLTRPEEALVAYNEVLRRYGESDTPALLELVAKALFNKGVILGRLTRPEEALVAYNEMLRRYGESDTPALLELVAKALVNKGVILDRLTRPEEALVAYDEVLRRYGESDTSVLVESVASALVNKGIILSELNRSEEGLAIYDEVLRRYGESDMPALLEPVAKALVNKGITLSELNRSEEGLAIYDEVLRRYGESDTPALLDQVVGALVKKGIILGRLNRHEDAFVVFNELAGRYGESETPVILEWVAMALVNKGIALVQLNRQEEALAAFDEVARRFEENEHPALREQAAIALIEKSDLEVRNQRYGAGIETAGWVIDQRLTESPENLWQGHLIRAQATLASGAPSACEQDIEAMLAILPKLDPLPREHLDALMEFSVEIGSARMRDLIQASPSANILLPLTTALERDLGLGPRVAREVEEVAEDIRRELAKLREGRTDDREASAYRR